MLFAMAGQSCQQQKKSACHLLLLSTCCAQGYFYELFKYEKNGTRKQIGHTMPLPQDPVQADVHVPGGEWLLEVRVCRGGSKS